MQIFLFGYVCMSFENKCLNQKLFLDFSTVWSINWGEVYTERKGMYIVHPYLHKRRLYPGVS